MQASTLRGLVLSSLLMSIALLAPPVMAVEMPLTAVASAGNSGTDTSGDLTLGFTIGLPIAGLSIAPSLVEIVGFWGIGASVSTVSVTDPGATPTLPTVSALRQNAPNPFNPVTNIRFEIGTDSGLLVPTRVDLFDAQGRLLDNLADGLFEPGHHAITWDGRDSGGRRVASGVYFARLSAGSVTQTIRMTLVK